MKGNFDFDDFVRQITKLKKNNPNQRMGQLIFNEIDFHRPVLSQKLRGSSIDPFYKDSFEEAYKALDWIEGNWNHPNPPIPG